jgi:hypothetical protein
MTARRKTEQRDYGTALAAIYKFERGDGSELAALLRSSTPLTNDARTLLADVVERMKVKPPTDPKGGRPRKMDGNAQAQLLARYEAAHKYFQRTTKGKPRERGSLTPSELAYVDVAATYRLPYYGRLDLSPADVAKIVTAARKNKRG